MLGGGNKVETTGERIKRLRNSVNLTQSELGDLLGVKKASIQKYENGSVVNLKTEIVESLANIFNVSPAYILGWIEYDRTIDTNTLSSEIKFLEEIHKRYGYAIVDLCEILENLNEDGKRKILHYAEDISVNTKFTIQDR